MFLFLYIFLITSIGTIAVFGTECSTEEPNNITTDCVSQCITSLYESIDCAGYKKIKNLTDIISDRNDTLPALIANEYTHVKDRMVSVIGNCENQNGIIVYRRPKELIDFMNYSDNIDNRELNHQTFLEIVNLFEQIKSKFDQSNEWCVRLLGLEEQMKRFKQKSDKTREFKITIVETSGGTTEHEPINFTYVIETQTVHPRHHHYKRSVWLILFISIVLIAVLITFAIFLRFYLSENTQESVQSKSMSYLVEIKT